MGQKAGGIAAKKGDNFEELYLLSYVGELLNENIKSLKSDSFGDPIHIKDDNHVEITLPNDGWCDVTIGIEDYYIGCQCKYTDISWTPRELYSKNILKNALIFQAQNKRNTYRLISRTTCTQLTDLIAESRKFNNINEFELHMAKGNNQFYELLNKEIENTVKDINGSTNRAFSSTCFEFLERFEYEATECIQLKNKLNTLEYIVGKSDKEKALRIVSDYFGSKTGIDINSLELWEELRKNNIRRQLLSEWQVSEKIIISNEKFKNSIYPIKGNIIPRKVTQDIINDFNNGERFIALHGESGYGKSGVLFELIKNYEDIKNTVTIPIRLDRKKIKDLREEFNRQSFKSISNKIAATKIIFIIDQFDALRWGTSDAKEEQDNCRSFIEEIASIDNACIIIACRSYDLNTEFQNIDTWLDKVAATWKRYKIEKLSKEEIADIIEEDINKFSLIKIDMLGCINNLKMYLELPQERRKIDDSKFCLHNEYLKTKQIEFENLTNSNSNSQFNNILECMINCISRTNELIIYKNCLKTFSHKEIAAMQNIGLIFEIDDVYMFTHQSIYDYLVTKRNVDEILNGISIKNILKKEPIQSLNIGERTKLILDQLYQIEEYNFYLSSIEELIYDNSIRFFIKEIALNILGAHDLFSKEAKKLYLKICKDMLLKNHFYACVGKNFEALKAVEYEITNDIFDKDLQSNINSLLNSSVYYDQGKYLLQIYSAIQDETIRAGLIERLFNLKYPLKIELQQKLVDHIKTKKTLPQFFSLEHIKNFDPNIVFDLLLNTFSMNNLEGTYTNKETIHKIAKRIADTVDINDDRILAALRQYCETHYADFYSGFNYTDGNDYFNTLNTLIIILENDLNKRDFNDWIQTYSKLLDNYKTTGTFFKILSICTDINNVTTWLINNDFLLYFDNANSEIIKFLKKYALQADEECINKFGNYIFNFNFFNKYIIDCKKYGVKIKLGYYGERNYELLNLLPVEKFNKSLSLKYLELKRKFGDKNVTIGTGPYTVVSVIENKIDKLSDDIIIKIIFSPNIKENCEARKVNGLHIESDFNSFKNVFEKAATQYPHRFLKLLRRIIDEQNQKFVTVRCVTEDDKIALKKRVHIFKLAILNGILGNYANIEVMEKDEFTQEEIDSIVNIIKTEDIYDMPNLHFIIRFIEKHANKISEAIEIIKSIIDKGDIQKTEDCGFFNECNQNLDSAHVYNDLINNDYLCAIEALLRMLINKHDKSKIRKYKTYIKSLIKRLGNIPKKEYQMMKAIGHMCLGFLYKYSLSDNLKELSELFKNDVSCFNAQWFSFFANKLVKRNEQKFENIFLLLIEKLIDKSDKEYVANAVCSYYIFYGYFKNCMKLCIAKDSDFAKGATKAVYENTNKPLYIERVNEVSSLLNNANHIIPNDYRTLSIDSESNLNVDKRSLIMDFMDSDSFKQDPWKWSQIVNKLKQNELKIENSLLIIDKLCEILIKKHDNIHFYDAAEFREILEDVIKKYTKENDANNQKKYLDFYDSLIRIRAI